MPDDNFSVQAASILHPTYNFRKLASVMYRARGTRELSTTMTYKNHSEIVKHSLKNTKPIHSQVALLSSWSLRLSTFAARPRSLFKTTNVFFGPSLNFHIICVSKPDCFLYTVVYIVCSDYRFLTIHVSQSAFSDLLGYFEPRFLHKRSFNALKKILLSAQKK